MLEETEEDVLAYLSFPTAHWRAIRSANPLERVSKKIARRTNVVGIFPTDASALQPVGVVLMEQDEEWQLATRYMSLHSLAKLMESETVGLLPAVA